MGVGKFIYILSIHTEDLLSPFLQLFLNFFLTPGREIRKREGSTGFKPSLQKITWHCGHSH